MSVAPATLREVMRMWATGVTVVTTAYGDERAGMTVSSFTSVSLEPPLILVSLHKNTRTAQLVEQSGKFAVSVLRSDQAHLSKQFAGFNDDALPAGADRFYNVALTTAVTDVPILADAIMWLDCTVHDVYDGYTHHIVLGEVQAAFRCEDEVAPLVYFNRKYHALSPEKPE